MIACRCGEANPPDARTCRACGAPCVALAAPPAGYPSPGDAGSDGDHTVLSPLYVDDETDRTVLSSATSLAPAAPTPDDPTRLHPLASRCPECNETVESGWRFCKACGAPVRASSRAARHRHAVVRVASDGSTEPPQPLPEGRTIVGRTDGDIVFPDDATLSSRHAAFVVATTSCEVVDLGSTNGTFVSLRGEEELEPGDVLLVGGKRLLYRRRGRKAELVEMQPRGIEGRRHALSATRTLIGKDPQAQVLFDDEHVSRRHAEIIRTETGHAVRDLGSTNRTYRIVTGRRVLREGDRVIAGHQVFEYRRSS